MTINVVWHSQEEGRGIYNCTTQLNDMFDHYDCKHIGGAKHFPKIEGGVVVVHGGREPGWLDKLNMDIEDLKWVLLIFLGDEEASFPIESVSHENAKIWIQEPAVPGKHEGLAHRYILDGYSHDFHKYKELNIVKDLEWVFAGQVTHSRRHECVAALQSLDWGGVIVSSKQYCGGVSKREYVNLMQRAQIAPCPSGPMSQDAARPWEALEVGAIPILDDLSPARQTPGFWEAVLGPSHPLPVIRDWAALPMRIEELKHGNLDKKRGECLTWWNTYKYKTSYWLEEDLKELGCTAPRLPF
jgi:hypothetical protein